MSFDSPSFLYLLFLLLPLFIFMLFQKKKRNRGAGFLVAFAAPEHREILKRKILFRIKLSDFFFIFFVGFLILALSGPRWGTELRLDNRRGLDLVLAIDISQT